MTQPKHPYMLPCMPWIILSQPSRFSSKKLNMITLCVWGLKDLLLAQNELRIWCFSSQVICWFYSFVHSWARVCFLTCHSITVQLANSFISFHLTINISKSKIWYMQTIFSVLLQQSKQFLRFYNIRENNNIA